MAVGSTVPASDRAADRGPREAGVGVSAGLAGAGLVHSLVRSSPYTRLSARRYPPASLETQPLLAEDWTWTSVVDPKQVAHFFFF